jgi:hypothetical protein
MDGQQQYADAMRAFDAYYGARHASRGVDWPKKRYSEHRSWKVFMKVADRCAKAGRDVERFVSTVVERSPKNSDVLSPNDLLTSRAEKLWDEHQNDRKADAAGKWAYFVRLVIQIQGATGQSDEAILLTALNAQFPAWFRIIYPESINDAIVAAWGEEALADLRADRDLVRFLRAAMAGKMEALEKKMGVVDGL